MDSVQATPLSKEGHGGATVVDFDSNDQLWTTHSFRSDNTYRNMGYVATLESLATRKERITESLLRSEPIG